MKVLIVLAALVAAACALPISDEEFKSSFESFKLQHGKKYATEEEELYRSKIFKENLIKVAEHNERYQKGEVTYTVGINKHSDKLLHELNAMRNGYRYSEKKHVQMVHKAPNAPWPWNSRVDWRSKGIVSAVKDQAKCGSCWAFSATGAIEAHVALKYGEKVSLSEQQIVDCTTFEPYNMDGCNGGLSEVAFQYIHDNGGIDSEDSYPYTALDGICNFNKTNVAAKVSSYAKVGATETDLLHAVQTVGPVSIAIDASRWGFHHYSGGVYYDAECKNGYYDLDHAVLAVGFGSNYWWGTNDYWIVKNSWGSDWGESGYVKMARNKDNNCGVATDTYYPFV